MIKMKVKINFTCYLISSLELLNVRQYLWVVVHMILPFLQTINLMAEFLVLSILVVLKLLLKLLTLPILKIILVFMPHKSLSNLFVLVIVARWLLVQVLCPWILHLQVVFQALSLWVLVKSTVNPVLVAHRRRLIIVCVKRCLCAELCSQLPCFVVVWSWVKIEIVTSVWNLFSARKTFQLCQKSLRWLSIIQINIFVSTGWSVKVQSEFIGTWVVRLIRLAGSIVDFNVHGVFIKEIFIFGKELTGIDFCWTWKIFQLSIFLRFNKVWIVVFFSQYFLRFEERLNLALAFWLGFIAIDCFSMLISNWWLDWWAVRYLWNFLKTCLALLVGIWNRLAGICRNIETCFIAVETCKMSRALNDSRWKERLAFRYFWLSKN